MWMNYNWRPEMLLEYQGSRFKNNAYICKSDACFTLKKRFQAVNESRGHMFATPTIHEDITTDNMKLKEFWCHRAATKLKVDQIHFDPNIIHHILLHS